MPLTFTEEDFSDTTPKPLTFSESDFTDSTPKFQISPPNQGLFQPSAFSSGLPSSTLPSENPDWQLTRAATDPTTGIPAQLNKGVAYAGNVARAIPADVAQTVAGEEPYYELHNLAAAALGVPLAIDEKLKEASSDSPKWATIGKISQGIAGTAPMAVLGGLPAAAQKLVLAGFTAKMMSDAPKIATQLGDELGKRADQQDPDKISSLVSDAIQSVGFSALGAVAMKRGLTPTTGKPNALQEPSANAEVLRNQQPEVGLPQVGERNVSQLQQPPAEVVKEAAPPETPVAETPAPAVELTTPKIKPADIAKMSPEEFVTFSSSKQGGMTGEAWRVGQAVQTPEEVAQLKSLQQDASAQVKKFTAEKDFTNGMAAALRGQFFREAYEAATGTGSAGEALAKEDPNYKPPFPIKESAPETAKTPAVTGNENQPVAAGGVKPDEVIDDLSKPYEFSLDKPTPPQEPVAASGGKEPMFPKTGKTVNPWRLQSNKQLRDSIPKYEANPTVYSPELIAEAKAELASRKPETENISPLDFSEKKPIPAKEPVIESFTPLEPQSGNPIVSQKFRVGKSPQLFSLVNKLEQTAAEKDNGEQAVTVRNEKTGEEHVVMESDLKPVTERTASQKSASRKLSVPDRLKSLGYTDVQINAMDKTGAKALADRGELVGLGAAVPSEFSGASRDIYGIAERVRQRREAAEMTAETMPGKGIAPEASVERGRQLLKAGADPERVMSDFEKSNRVSSDDFAVVRAHGETLARITNKTEENFGTNSPEFRSAYKTESDWAKRTKAMQTEWAKSGHAQQGEVDIDTGTFSGLKRAYRDAHGGQELPKADEAKAKELAVRSRKVFNDSAELLKKVGDAIDKEVPSSAVEKPPTAKDTSAVLFDYKGGKMTTPQVRALWKYTKKNYIDKGNADFSDIVNKVATDLGLSFKDVANGLSQPKSVRKLTNELWRKQTDARRVTESAKRWVRSTNQPILGQILPRTARIMFGIRTFGHGTVAFGTHAPMVAFLPKYSKTYFRDFGKMYKMVFKPAEYEIEVQALRSSPNYDTAQRAGLVNDPYKVEDFNNPDMSQYFGRLSGAGNRGYFALKILRQGMFDQGWDKLPESLKTPEMAKAMADDINHITGVIKSRAGGNIASLFLFAPRLLASRAAFLVGDPYKAAEIMSTAMTPARWKALSPEQKFIVTNQLKQKATILAVAYGLLQANQAMLSATGSKQKINTTDPTRSDFWKFKVGGMDVSYGNAMMNMARLPIRLWTIGAGDGGKLKHVIYPDESMYSAAGEFLRSQASPFTSLVTDIIFKGDYQNRPLPQIPGYGKPIPLPKRLAAQGIKPYTWPEFFATQVLPIPLQEPNREIWHNGFHLNEREIGDVAKAAGAFVFTIGTGGRVSEDYLINKK